ncbi:MFS transporter [Erwinia rhapontici]|uniref:MFS transporter n=2 Tax=Erwinia rhapontici TaxID=55212 RepID=A0ABM7N155_ERWRD|nr:putative MFS family arabinose efflux permease [Erwinia rhapontici]TDT02507.1 putative MFS family arabinose efflux permease [Erwinia rhapontici]BCQ35120.1 MFS transporter [Erwinia rhapontici]BCQ40023.1 MFS transporter [Erwinia rhapontici]BCQ45230.1 MFS transporter [Erwinia rhapontici]
MMNTFSTMDSVRHTWTAVIAVGLATFSVVTTEMLPVGLLTSIAGTLSITTGSAGLMISLPALLAALFAPFVVIASGGIDRRWILCGLLALLVVANLASALAPDLIVMLAARMLVGFCMGGIWAIAGGLASRLVPEKAIGLATSIIFGGVAAASVLGVPLGAFIGDVIGWRWAFGIMAIFSALVLAFHLAVIPALPVTGSANLSHFIALLGNRKIQTGLFLTLLLVTSHFVAFTFVRPLLISVSGFDTQWIGAILLAYGIAGIGGNFLAGITAARYTAFTLTAIATGLVLTPLLFIVAGQSVTGGSSVLIFWGLAYGGLSVGLMTWMMKAAPRAVEIAAALYVGVFNTGIALGSWSGGQIVDRLALTDTLWLACGLATVALILAVAAGMNRGETR